MSEPNVVLVGPMGSGKSTVGALTAARLGRPFVDIDREIERRAGRTVAQLFAERGEAAFRALETEVCRHYAVPRGCVLATGGGTLVDPSNREALAAGGRLAWLRARQASLWGRVAASPPRPLLERLPPAARPLRLEALDRAREPGYRAAEVELDAEPAAAEVAAELARLVRSRLWMAARRVQRIEAARSALYVGRGIRAAVGEALRVHGLAPGPVVVLSDPRVRALHGDVVAAGLREAGFAVRWLELPAGEAAKQVRCLVELWERLLEAGVQRSTPLVALGGGALTDVAGFAAGTILRGVPWLVVPTTMLGMVDAGLGGKTAINLSAGKNLAGALVAPRAVLVDPECLATLGPGTPPGMAEVLKHALLADPELWTLLELAALRPDPRAALDAATLVRAAGVKLERVAADPRDLGVRRTLNLGHTFAHGFEYAADFALPHGHAVGVGLVAAAAVSEAEGYAEAGLADRVERALASWRLPTRLPAQLRAGSTQAMRRDKKAQGQRVEVTLLRAIGVAQRAWLPFSALEVGLDRVLYSGKNMSCSDSTLVFAASPQESSRSPTAPRLASP